MQQLNYDIIGTHLTIVIDTIDDCQSIFQEIRHRLHDFEQKFSRFIEMNWLHDLNTTRHALLDDDARTMLLCALDIASKTDGYFDPTVGKRLTELGY
jgi:thiamine biosynthesis lipoprotein ApbE